MKRNFPIVVFLIIAAALAACASPTPAPVPVNTIVIPTAGPPPTVAPTMAPVPTRVPQAAVAPTLSPTPKPTKTPNNTLTITITVEVVPDGYKKIEQQNIVLYVQSNATESKGLFNFVGSMEWRRPQNTDIQNTLFGALAQDEKGAIVDYGWLNAQDKKAIVLGESYWIERTNNTEFILWRCKDQIFGFAIENNSTVRLGRVFVQTH